MDKWKSIRDTEKVRDGEGPKREDAGTRKGKKVAKNCVFEMICGSGGSKSRLAKAAGEEPARQMKDEKMHAVFGREAHLEVKSVKTPQGRTTFGS